MKKIILMLIVFSLLVLPSCKKATEIVEENAINIIGTWYLEIEVEDTTGALIGEMTLTGSNTEGAIQSFNNGTGQYTVTNKSNISCSITVFISGAGNCLLTFSGTIHSDKSMTGSGNFTFLDYSSERSLTWTATKM